MRVHANGRVRRSRSEWREIFDRFEASGLSQTEFCRRESIAKGTFSRWMKVLLCGTPCAGVRWNAASLKIAGGEMDEECHSRLGEVGSVVVDEGRYE